MSGDELRDRLFSALAAAQESPQPPVPDGLYAHEGEAIVVALLPVVRAYAAEELRAAADGLDGGEYEPAYIASADVLRDRADALTAATEARP